MEREPSDGIKAELLRMAEADQEIREQVLPDHTVWDASVDEANTARLNEIIDETGWPTVSVVGAEAAHAAWLIAQHSPNLDFMKRCLALMEAAGEGEASPADKAYLEDRIRTLEGRPQRYGTQFHGRGETFAAFPIEDPENLDARRAAVGLAPFEENMQAVRKYYGI